MSDSLMTLMWLPGTLLGVGVGILGAVIGVQASRGTVRRDVVKLFPAQYRWAWR